MPLSPGARLGPYEVIAPVGAGGMGEVFRARDTRLDRTVAIKVIAPEFAQRFEREARAISALNHPHICTLFDVGPNYLVMELLDGETLSERLAKGPLPVAEVLKLGAQIADALDRAHKAGIVHRDLKPSNVMLTRSGAKLLDFGLAKESRADSSLSSQLGMTMQKPLTEEGTLLGTYQYMAPEQLAGEQADARTDIFALGAVLYEMVTGHRAFEGKTKTSIITSIVSREPSPISEVQPFTPPALEHMVRRCLSKDPDDRWQSAHDIATQLRWISESGSGAGLAAPVLRTRRSRERMLWIAALIVVAAAAAITASKLHLGEVPHQYRFTVPMIGDGYSLGNNARLSPDGETIYFRASTDGGHRWQIFRRRLDELTATPIAGTEDAFVALPSFDGKSLLLSFSGAVYKRVAVNGGPAETIVEGSRIGNLSSSFPDGSVLFGGDDMPVSRVLPNHRVIAVTKLDPAYADRGHTAPYVLPDGKTFLFLAVNRDPQRGTIRRTLCASTLGANEITRIGELPSRFEYAAGHLFYIRAGTLMAQPFDIGKLRFTGDAAPVADDVQFNGRFALASFSVARNGTLLYQTFSPPYHLTVIDANGKAVSMLAPPHLLGSRFATDADGSHAIVTMGDHRTGVSSLWNYDVRRDTATRLTFSPANEMSAVMTPDGRRVFFSCDALGPFDVFTAPSDGSQPAAPFVVSPNVQIPTDVSPDGKYVLYTTNQTAADTKQDLFVVPVEGGKPRPFLVTPAIENDGVFSRDGKWVAYTSDATGTLQIFVRPFPGPGPARQVSTKGGHFARFSRDGKRLYFADETKLMAADFRADGSTGDPVVAFDSADQILAFEPLANGRIAIDSINSRDVASPVRVVVGWHP